MSNKQQLIETVRNSKPEIQSTFKSKGKEYALIKYKNDGFTQYIQIQVGSPSYKQVFEKPKAYVPSKPHKHGKYKSIITAQWKGKQVLESHIREVYLQQEKAFRLNIAL